MDNGNDYSKFDDDLQNILEAMRVIALQQSRQARKTEQIEKTLTEFFLETRQRLDIIEKKVFEP